MKYKFPEIISLKQVESAIKGRDEFVIGERDWGYVINYQVNYEDTFPEVKSENAAIRRECRGIKFNKNGTILARPLHKFFNLNEKPETNPNTINWDHHFVILEKLDGSMVHPMLADNQIIWSTKMGPTDVSAMAETFIAKNPQYNDFVWQLLNNEIYTPIFEWCSRKNRIVIDYPEDKLVLIALRNNIDGHYVGYEELNKLGHQWNIPVVGSWNDTFYDIDNFVKNVQDRENEEGYVLRFSDGHMIKIKNFWYVQLHKTKELMAFEKDVWSLILNNSEDDAKAFMEQDEKERLEAFARDLRTSLDETADELYWVVIAAKDNLNESKKRFALEVVPNYDKYKSALFKIWDGYDPKEVVYNIVLNGLSSSTKLESVRHYAKGIKWQDYYKDINDS